MFKKSSTVKKISPDFEISSLRIQQWLMNGTKSWNLDVASGHYYSATVGWSSIFYAENCFQFY